MSCAKTGNVVHVHYTGTLDDGTIFDSSKGREPLEFELGKSMVIPGFENAVEGMEIGDKKTVHIPVEEAYGEHNKEMVVKVERKQMPPHIQPEVGLQLQMGPNPEQSMPVVITEVHDDYLVMDANHPLAGKNLNFELELVKID